MEAPVVEIKHIGGLDIGQLDAAVWSEVYAVSIDHYWSGEIAPASRHCEARILRSENALYVRFDCVQVEPLVIERHPQTEHKTIGLWDRDVCEIFIAPDIREPKRYFEFEAAPTAEWVDLSIDFTSGKRVTDQAYSSGMRAQAGMDGDQIRVAMEIPWDPIGLIPRPGVVFLGNLYRCVGQGPDRGYLAWRPTLTDIPNFHVPERSGKMVLV